MSYHYLTRERGMGHAQANQALVKAYRLDQHGRLAVGLDAFTVHR